MIDAYQHGGNVALDAERNCIYGTTRYNNGGVPDNFGNHFIVEFDKPIVESEQTRMLAHMSVSI